MRRRWSPNSKARGKKAYARRLQIWRVMRGFFQRRRAKPLLRPVSARPDAGNVSAMEKLATPLRYQSVCRQRKLMRRALNRRWYSGKISAEFSAVTAQCSQCGQLPDGGSINANCASESRVIVAGVDWARLHDFTAISVVCWIASAKWA